MAQAQIDSKYSTLPSIKAYDFSKHMQSLCGAKIYGTIKQDHLSKIVVDSRKIESGCVFIAIKGTKSDGHNYIKTASDQKASLIVCESYDDKISTPQLIVRSSREAWAWACSQAWNHPQKRIKMLGVTGTNGKTSTVWMIRNILNSLSMPTATIGTLGFYIGEIVFETKHTTPDPDVLYGMIQFAVDSNQTVLAMEVASHAIDQEKLAPIAFEAAAWTSFSQDHLDYHGTMEKYFSTKARLFSSMMASGGVCVLNSSIKNLYVEKSLPLPKDSREYSFGLFIESTPKKSFVNFGTNTKRGHSNVTCQWRGMKASFTIPFIGDIFAENFLSAIELCSTVVDPVEICRQSESISKGMSPVPGRLEPAVTDKPGRPLVLVEHAHTPDALEKAISVARSITSQKLLVVFGCGGDRDPTKRPIMGRIAEDLCDRVYVTSDNPRSENPSKIIKEILGGQHNPNLTVAVEDRFEAISAAINSATLGDTVLIAGKGHETYQIFADRTLPFSDLESAHQVLNTQKKWCLLGMGVSGKAAAQFLLKHNDQIVISDGGSIDLEFLTETKKNDLKIFENSNSSDCLDGCSALVVSPGVGSKNSILQKALELGLPILTEIDLGFEKYKGTSICVTGTNGKSTICALADFALKQLGLSSNACGNIGVPPTSLNDSNKIDSYRVCELSSYQLEFSKSIQKTVAIFSSFSFDHLARHGTIEEYFRCKWLITNGLNTESLFVLTDEVFTYALKFGARFPDCRTIVVQKDGVSLASQAVPHSAGSWFEFWSIQGSTVFDSSGQKVVFDGLKIFGQHNILNSVIVYASLLHLRLTDIGRILKAISSFEGLPYRCQKVFKTPSDKPVFNDSKSTNVESTLVALSSMQEPVVLLLGGAGKGESFEQIALHSNKIKKIFSFGAYSKKIESDLSKDLNVQTFDKMFDAVVEAYQYAESQKLPILFSPACASFDEFKNFEHRGEFFNETINKLGGLK